MLAEALAAGASVEGVYTTQECLGTAAVEEAGRRGVDVAILAPGVIERVADTVTPQPVLAVVQTVDVGLDELRGSDFLLICIDLRDPGNAGTLLRAAEAAGVGGVVCCGGTVDVFNPKTVRASAGAIFNVRVAVGAEAIEVMKTVGSWGVRRLAADPHEGTPYTKADLTAPVALVVGNEAHGLAGRDLDAVLDGRVRIPMRGRTESLNVAMAATLLCFEAARQREAAWS